MDTTLTRVKQLMSAAVVTIGQDASCREAVALMARRRIRHLPVVGRDGRMCGIVTDRDLRHHLFRPDVLREIGSVPADRLLSAVRVRELMSTPVISIGAEDTLEEAAARMRGSKIGALPVVEGREVVGILTETDVLRRIVGDDTGDGELDAIVVSYP